MNMNRVAKLREELGLTQSELAEKLSISTSSVGMYEQGRRIPSPKILSRMAKLFDASIEYILGSSPVRMRPSNIKSIEITTDPLPEGWLEEKLLQSALQDDKGKDMLKQLIKEKIDEISSSPLESGVSRAIGKMLTSLKDDESKQIRIDIIRTIAEADLSTEQLKSFRDFLFHFMR